MITLEGFSINDKIFEDSRILVYKGKDKESNTPVIIKLLNEEYPTPDQLYNFENEYNILIKLKGVKGIINNCKMINCGNSKAIIMEDTSSLSLSQILKNKKVSIKIFLVLAVKLCEILRGVHSRRIIHKDIKPGNILFNEKNLDVYLIDFSLSTQLLKINQEAIEPDFLQGTLQYISPEQTGRMNRSIDYRTDYYSLGVTFYEIVSGELPFTSQDAMELIHSHIAINPKPPHEINPVVPIMISRIIMKLLSKNPEDRYQSITGLIADLLRCDHSLKKDGTIEIFEPGTEDISDRFQIPEKLYGRGKEISHITDLYYHVSQGHKDILFVTGESGIGKSAIIGEIRKHIIEKNGYFIFGKYNQFKRNVPYSAIIQSFGELVKQILTRNQQEIDSWKKRILNAVGDNGQVITDVIPKIELIIGSQKPVQKLGIQEAQNRFNVVFQNFIHAFCRKENPLILFLDDLQWADHASLSLLEMVFKDLQIKYFLFLGSYRDNEVDMAHSLTMTLDGLKNDGINWDNLHIKHLSEEHIQQLIEDTICCKSEQNTQLATLVYQKTGGNPFFLVEFLKRLYREELIYFDDGWQIKIDEIMVAKITDNVVELMAEKIKLLPSETLLMLKMAACVGVTIYMDTLSIIALKTRGETIRILEPAINEGMLVQICENCKFVHDHVHEATYSLINDTTAKELHYKIGMSLFTNPLFQPWQEKIFSIVSHFNLCQSILSIEEKERVAKLNLEAGKKAKANAAWEAAVIFFNHCEQLLPKNPWESQYQSTLELITEICEVEYMARNYEKFLSYSEIIQKKVKPILEKIKIIKLLINYHSTQQNFNEAIKIGVKNLKKLGFSLPFNPSRFTVLPDIIKIRLKIKKEQIPDLFNFPDINSPKHEAILELVQELAPSAYMGKPDLMPIIVTTAILISLKHGNNPITAYSFTAYGFIVASIFGDVEVGYQFGLLGLKLGEKYGDKYFLGKINYVMNFISHWKYPYDENIKYLKIAMKYCKESGDFQYLGLSYHWYPFAFFVKGVPLITVEKYVIDLSPDLMKLKQKSSELLFKLFRQFYHNLTNKENEPCHINGEFCNEKLMIKQFQESNDITRIGIYTGIKIFLYYLFAQYDKGFTLIIENEKYIKTGCLGQMLYPWFYFIAGLILAKQLENKPKQHKLRIRFKKIIKMFKKWGKDNPINYGNKLLLLLAEKNKIEGSNTEITIASYDQAIVRAKEQGFMHEEAMANELAALYCHSKNLLYFASCYINRAHFLYQKWGSIPKVKHIEHLYPQMLKEINSDGRQNQNMTSAKINRTISSTTGSSSSNYDNFLDITTILKANQALSSEIEMNSLLTKMLIILIENAGAEKGFLILNQKEELKIEAKCAGKNARIISQQLNQSDDVCVSIIQYVAKSLEVVVLDQAIKDSTFKQDKYIQKNEIKSVLCLPIINQKRLVGILYLENNLSIGAFTNDRIEMLKVLSTQAAISIENARLIENMKEKERLKQEMKIAEHIQRSLCIQPPVHDDLELTASMKPAEEVGGDYYDIIFDDDNNLWLAIGDVSGHGLTAGLVMMMAETLFNSFVKTEKHYDPATLITSVNRILFENVRERMGEFHFMTMTFLKYEGSGRFAHAGLNLDIIIWRNRTKSFEIIKTEGIYLSVLNDIKHVTTNGYFTLEPGDVMLLYTDGIIEARASSGKLLELEGLMEIMESVIDKNVQVINDTILEKTLAFCHNKPIDDITMIVVRMK